MRHTIVLTRDGETNTVTREDSDTCIAAAWLLAYIRGALLSGWTLVRIESQEVT